MNKRLLHAAQTVLKEPVEAEGTEIVLHDTVKAPLRGLQVYGKSVQMTTKGTNLCDFRNYPTSIQNGVTITADEYGVITLSGTPTVESGFITTYMHNGIDMSLLELGKTYYSNISIQIHHEDHKSWCTSFVFDESMVSVRPYIQPNVKDYIDGKIIKPVLSEGSLAEWEPYTGGIPSPSPEYPQEIVSVGDSGSIKANIRGKNLNDGIVHYLRGNMDGAIHSQSIPVSIIIPINGGDTYTISIKEADTIFHCTTEDYPSAGIQIHDAYTGSSGRKITEKTMKTSVGAKYLVINIGSNNVGILKNAQVEAGDESTKKEPYSHQSITVSTPTGLPGIPVSSGGNYTDASGQQWVCDEVDFERGVYVQRIGTLYGNDFKWNDLGNRFIATCDDVNKRFFETEQYAVVLCNIAVFSNTSKENTCRPGNKSNAYIQIIYATKDTDMSNVVYMYQCEPIETSISAAELAAYKSLHSNYPTTIITNSEDAHMKVNCLKIRGGGYKLLSLLLGMKRRWCYA